MHPYTKQTLEEFDEKVNEVRRLTHFEGEESEILEFGGKICRDGVENFTVPDWGNIRKFLSKAIEGAYEEGYENGFNRGNEIALGERHYE